MADLGHNAVSMIDSASDWLFGPIGLTPHGFCLLWEPGLIWTYAVSDILIGLAYFSIPLALLVIANRRRDLIFRPLFILFAAFILCCGTTHLLDVLTLWVPAYGVEGFVKAVTAVVSTITAVFLWRLLPQALTLPSPAQLHAANTALAQSEARYRASFELSPVPVYTLDSDDVITSASESWLKLLGYEYDEVVGRHVSAFWPAGSDVAPGKVMADRAELEQTGEVRDRERYFQRCDGTIIEALVSARLERGDNGTRVIAAVNDVTARRRAEAALRRTEDSLRQAQKMEAVGQLTGGIAHDFNNMLQSITAGLDLMERRIADGRTEEAARFAAIARQSVDRAAGLTHRMLAFARRQPLHAKPVEPDQLVHGLEDLIRRTIGTEVEFTMCLRDGVWRTLCDANQLESALLNLAINARDAMPGGGSLSITTADRHLGPADLSDEAEVSPGAYVELAVADTGMGMTPDVLRRAFEPFFTTKPVGHGTGLGLSQVFGFVRQSGGFVRLESTPGQGTTVRVYLPRYDVVDEAPSGRPNGAGAEPQAEGHPAGLAAGTVLLVEDEDNLRRMISERLRDIGCVVLEAGDGDRGLQVARSERHLDLLITDVRLPVMNGRQLAETVRTDRPGLSVLFITGYADKVLADLELSPVTQILSKPFSLDVLIDRVRNLLAPSTAAKEVAAD